MWRGSEWCNFKSNLALYVKGYFKKNGNHLWFFNTVWSESLRCYTLSRQLLNFEPTIIVVAFFAERYYVWTKLFNFGKSFYKLFCNIPSLSRPFNSLMIIIPRYPASHGRSRPLSLNYNKFIWSSVHTQLQQRLLIQYVYTFTVVR